MNRLSSGVILWMLAALSALGLGAPNPAAPATTNVPALVTPPLPTPTKSPVALFRELLALPYGERRQLLTNRPPETQQRILAKVREYETMPADARELRLQATELRFYLRPLMSLAPEQRTPQVALLPEEFRQLVTDRLRLWDILPPPLQKELLENEATLQFFTELNTASEAQTRHMLDRIPVAQREKLNAGMQKWNAIPEEDRRRIVLRFNEFFELNAREKSKALSRLSEPERVQIEKTLKKFGALTPQQRATCIRSFEKFASLTLEERQMFLKNAEQWSLMTPQERQSWRDLVAKLPLVPTMPTRMPPLPTAPRPKATNALLNQGPEFGPDSKPADPAVPAHRAIPFSAAHN